MAQCIFFLTPIEPAHYQHVLRDASFAQDYTLVGRGDSEPCRSRVLQRQGAFFHPVSICVAFHHRADRNGLADMLLEGGEVVAQSGERDLGPVRPGFYT